MSDADRPDCHVCTRTAVAVYRVAVRPYAGTWNGGGPRDVYVCGMREHQDQARLRGVVLRVRTLTDDVVVRKVKGEPEP